jgi:hypothetical protein
MKPTLRLDWVDHKAAKYAVEHWHYSRSLPTPPLVRVGVWENGKYIGVVLFSRGASDAIGKPFGLRQTEVAELTRVALAEHETPVSRIVAVAIRLLRQASPRLRLLVSYADPQQGHIGGLYQAGGWTYIGSTDQRTDYKGPDGKVWHSRMISASGRKKVYGEYRPVWRPDQCKVIIRPGKYKYVMPLDDAMREQIAPLAKPYPKRRAEGVDSDTPSFHDGEGGAVPTSALHESSGVNT